MGRAFVLGLLAAVAIGLSLHLRGRRPEHVRAAGTVREQAGDAVRG